MTQGPVEPVPPSRTMPIALKASNDSVSQGVKTSNQGLGHPHLLGLGLSQGRGLALVLATLGLFASAFLFYRIFSRPGPLIWSSQPAPHFVAGQPAAFRIKTDSPSGFRTRLTTNEHGGAKETDSTSPLGRINPNTASHEELCELPGVGKVIASRIIAARADKPFNRAEDLRRVQGIGAKTLERIRPQLIFETDKPSENGTPFNDGTHP